MDYKVPFNRYKQSLFGIANDLKFWPNRLKDVATNTKSAVVMPTTIFSSIFHVYDLDESTNTGILSFLPATEHYVKDELLIRSEKFINWIINLALLRAYNNVELLLLESIWMTYYPQIGSPIGNRRNTVSLGNEIGTKLKTLDLKVDRSNNNHIIAFLRSEVSRFNSFSNCKVRVDLELSWAQFFEFISVLRHIVAHQDSCYDYDTLNELKSKATQLYSRHFESKQNHQGYYQLTVVQEQIGNFLSYYNDFALNTLKFIADEDDLQFLGMENPTTGNT